MFIVVFISFSSSAYVLIYHCYVTHTVFPLEGNVLHKQITITVILIEQLSFYYEHIVTNLQIQGIKKQQQTLLLSLSFLLFLLLLLRMRRVAMVMDERRW